MRSANCGTVLSRQLQSPYADPLALNKPLSYRSNIKSNTQNTSNESLIARSHRLVVDAELLVAMHESGCG